MDEFEQSNSEKETNDSHNTCYQNAIPCKENAFSGRMADIFSVGLKKTDKSFKI